MKGGGNGEIQFVSFVSLLSGKLSKNQVISLGLNSMYYFFSALLNIGQSTCKRT